MASREELIGVLAGREPVSSREVQRLLGVSQATVSRLISRAGPRVARVGRGPSTRYAATQRVFSASDSVPLFCMDASAVISHVGDLRALTSGQYLVQAQPDAPFWLLGETSTGLFDSLPYFLHDLRPSGFLGRQLARSLAAVWGVPQDPRAWQDAHIGRFLLERGHDLTGNLLVGEAAVELARRQQQPKVKTVDFPSLAERALGDEQVGSSAAGEQPKFVVRRRWPVVVKFSPAGSSAEARRWQDLLCAEHHALKVMSEHAIPAVDTTLHRIEGRVFLQSRRFDRPGPGRSPCISITMVDAEFGGQGHGWARVAHAVHATGLLDRGGLEQLAWAETFGAWIGNTDMHLGNVSLAPGQHTFELCPLYDMLPMALAPVRGELPEVELRPPIRDGLNRLAWEPAGRAAVAYWRMLAEDAGLTHSFRSLARRYARRHETVLGI